MEKIYRTRIEANNRVILLKKSMSLQSVGFVHFTMNNQCEPCHKKRGVTLGLINIAFVNASSVRTLRFQFHGS